jgi:hypothetical protein
MIYITVLSKKQAQINALRLKKLTGCGPPPYQVWVTDGACTFGYRRLADVKADPRYRNYRIVLFERRKGIATGVLRTYAEQREAERYAENMRDEVAIRAEAPFRDWRY